MNDNPPKDIYPPDFTRPQTVEDMGNRIIKLIFPDGFSCYAQSKDEAEWIYNEIMAKQEYFQNGLAVEEARCVFDIGANIGIFTLAVKLKSPEAAVYAFEPIPETFQIQEQNVRLLGCSDTHLYNVALGSQDQVEETFTFFPTMPGNSTSLPDLIAEQGPAAEQIFGKEEMDLFWQVETRNAQVRTLSSAAAQWCRCRRQTSAWPDGPGPDNRLVLRGASA